MMPNTAPQKVTHPCLQTLSRAFEKIGVHTTHPDKLKEKYDSDHSQYATVEGMVIHYQDEGEGPVIILSHGVMASLHTWDAWVDILKSKYCIIRFDIPDFGLSDSNTSKQFNPEYTVALFYLVGNALGGFISWNYAATYPERVKSLF